jgi:glycosyltransferase involved in cell wall biosynthesis
MKRYGIFIAYPPQVDLRKEGLGRHLASFIKGAEQRDDVSFVLACPNWSRKSIEELFESEQVNASKISIISPPGSPALLTIFELIQKIKSKRKKKKASLFSRIKKHLSVRAGKAQSELENYAASSRSIWSALSLAPALLILSPLAAITYLLYALPMAIFRLLKNITSSSKIIRRIRRRRHLIGRIFQHPKGSGMVRRLYQLMAEHESTLVSELCNRQTDVIAWYAPTAFWKGFNKIQKPRLMCVPDVVLAEFPVEFGAIGGEIIVANLREIEASIRGCENFVTYSEKVKWETLVDRYLIDPSKVSVIHHAPNELNDLVFPSGFANIELTSRNYCQSLISNALLRTSQSQYDREFKNRSFKYIFYASQLRPNKNVITLLRAYEHLLREKFVPYKLVLTGSPDQSQSVREYVEEKKLQHDVIFLSGLRANELAACYKLATLAVNPSLSEGGCPFTFTEAMSVGTPAIMARIPVTQEVLFEPELQATSLFDPYDWKAMADKIAWAVDNRDQLIALQEPVYERLAKRDWSNVVGEHLKILDQLAEETTGAA